LWFLHIILLKTKYDVNTNGCEFANNFAVMLDRFVKSSWGSYRGWIVALTYDGDLCLHICCRADAGAADKSVDALAFETLIPKSIIQRYVSLLVEHRRIILCGPSGTGKTFLANRLAEYLVLRWLFFDKSCLVTVICLFLFARLLNGVIFFFLKMGDFFKMSQ